MLLWKIHDHDLGGGQMQSVLGLDESLEWSPWSATSTFRTRLRRSTTSFPQLDMAPRQQDSAEPAGPGCGPPRCLTAPRGATPRRRGLLAPRSHLGFGAGVGCMQIDRQVEVQEDTSGTHRMRLSG